MRQAARYSIDTSALIDWWVRYYPPKNFSGLVPKVEALIDQGRLRASREVRDEIERESDELQKWAKRQTNLFVESSDEIQAVVRQLMKEYYNSEKPEKGISGADPFVIGVAATSKPQPWYVVTGEKIGSSENPKIPWVCRRFQPTGIKHLSFLEMVAMEGWDLK